MPLSDADHAIVAADPALPGLALALDADAVAARLGLGPLAPAYLRYKPGETCTAHFHGGGAGITLRAVTRERYATYRARREWQGPDGPARFLDEACAVALPAGADRAVKAARRLLDPVRGPRCIAALLGPGAWTLHPLRVKPGRRIALRADRDGVPVAIVKAVARKAWAQLLAGARAAAARPGLGLPLLAADADACILAQPWLAGETADAARHDPARFAAIGSALARLQIPAVPGADAPHPAYAALESLIDLAPHLAPRAERIAAMLRIGLAEPAAPRFCHGDFSADQVLLTPDGQRILDWDRAGPGAPLGDLGSFLARLDMDRLDGLAPARADAAAVAFVSGYSAARGPVPEVGLAIARAAGLAALAIEPFRRRLPDWSRRTGTLLAETEALLAPVAPVADALDPARMEAAFAPVLGPLRLETPVLLRHRPGRRALVAYSGEGPSGRLEAVAKLGLKRGDRHTPALHRTLAAEATVCVPRVLGEFPEQGLWLQERIAGRTLTDLLAPAGDPAPFAAAGAALARLHASRAAAPRTWRLADEAAVLADALARAAAARPDLAPRLGALGAALAPRLAALPPAASPVLLHRDFYPDQALWDGARLTLIDLDLHASGDAAIDVANFLAHVDEHALRHHGAATACAAQCDAFLVAYEAEAPGIEPGRLALLRRASFARHAWIALRIPARAAFAEAILSHALTTADRWHAEAS